VTTQTNPASENAPLDKNGHTRIMPMAKYLGLHHQTLRRWIKQNRIPQPKTVNGIQLFSNAEILEWLDNDQQQVEGV
jgi:excisionase family DNA binding protein